MKKDYHRTRDTVTIRDAVLAFFDGDSQKTDDWFATPNPQLGDMSPAEMIALGRVEKLATWVRNQLEV